MGYPSGTETVENLKCEDQADVICQCLDDRLPSMITWFHLSCTKDENQAGVRISKALESGAFHTFGLLDCPNLALPVGLVYSQALLWWRCIPFSSICRLLTTSQPTLPSHMVAVSSS